MHYNFIQKFESKDVYQIEWREKNTTTSIRFWLQLDWYFVSKGTNYPLQLPKNWIMG